MLNSRGKVGNEKHTVFRHSHNFKAPGQALQKFFRLTPPFFFAHSLYPTYISRAHLGPSLLFHVLIILFLHLSSSQVLPRSVWIDSLFLFVQGLLNHPHPVKYQYFSILCWLYPLSLKVQSLPFCALKGWFLWTTSPRLLCPLVSIWFQPIWRHWQMIRGRKEREVRILISPSPTLPPACLWLLAGAWLLYLRPWLGSDSPVPWLQVLASSRNRAFPLSFQA